MKSFSSGFFGCLGVGFAVFVVLSILASIGQSNAVEEDVCSIWSQFIDGEEEQAAYDAACPTTTDDRESTPTGGNTRAWRLSGSRMQENGGFLVRFRLTPGGSSDSVILGCDSNGMFIAFDSLPWSITAPTAIIEIGDSMETYRGRIDDDLLIFRSSILIDRIIEHNDEIFVFIDRDWDEAQQRRG